MCSRSSKGVQSSIRATAVLLAALACTAAGQAPDSTHRPPARIIGVFDTKTGAPLQGVQVRDAFSGTFAVTTVTGTVRLAYLTFRGAAALVDLRKLGYQAKQIVVTAADSTPITETMDPIVALAPVVTTEKYRIDRDAGTWEGLLDRCESKSVTCIGPVELEKRLSANLADVLIHADGITIGSCGGGPRNSSRSGQCGKIAMRPTTVPPSYCQPTFFVDGHEWNSRGGAPADLAPGRPAEAPYTPSNVKAIEVYPSDKPRPLRFQGDPTCGAVVIWTK